MLAVMSSTPKDTVKRFVIPAHPISLLCVIGFTLAVTPGCMDETRPGKSSTCTTNEDCADGLCYQSLCLDPSGDDDLDGLINGNEVTFKTDPFDADTDDDGLPDGSEVGAPETPLDTDNDGVLDALECNSCDDDCDGLGNHEDAVHELSSENLAVAGNGDSYIGWYLASGSWGTSSGCEQSPEAYSGGAFLFVGHDICQTYTESIAAAQIDQTIQLPALPADSTGEHLLEVSAWVGTHSPGSTALVLGQLFDASNDPVGEGIRLEVDEPAWTHRVWTGALPHDATTLELSLRVEGPTPGHPYATFDDLTVWAIRCDDSPTRSDRTPPEASPGEN